MWAPLKGLTLNPGDPAGLISLGDFAQPLSFNSQKATRKTHPTENSARMKSPENFGWQLKHFFFSNFLPLITWGRWESNLTVRTFFTMGWGWFNHQLAENSPLPMEKLGYALGFLAPETGMLARP